VILIAAMMSPLRSRKGQGHSTEFLSLRYMMTPFWMTSASAFRRRSEVFLLAVGDEHRVSEFFSE